MTHQPSLPLAALHVTCVGSSRPVLGAARWYADLGASVRLRGCDQADPVDRIWLTNGIPEEATGEIRPSSLCIVEAGAKPVEAGTVVVVSSTGSASAKHGVQLTEREVAALGGVAVAVGEPGREPLPLPPGCLDMLIAAHVAAAGVAGLLGRHSRVEVAAVDVVASAVATNAGLYLPYDMPWTRAGRRASHSGGCYPYGIFKVADGQVCLIGRSGRDWSALLSAMGDPDWSAQPRYRDLVAMGAEYPDEVDALLDSWLGQQTCQEVMEAAAKFGFPAGPVRTPQQVLAIPALESWWKDSTVEGRRVSVPGIPFEWQPFPSDGLEQERITPQQTDVLAGQFVLDLSWVWSGPAVGSVLADLGATVAKVESSARLDNTRLRGRPSKLSVANEAPNIELNPYFHAVNHGKRSIALNLTTDSGRSLLAELATGTDVLLENMRSGVMTRLGVDHNQMRERNPHSVCVSLRGYRSHPSVSNLRAYAPVLSAGAGIEALVSYPRDSPIGLMTFGLADANSAAQGAVIALAGLWARAHHGCGAALTLSQFEATVMANGRNLIDAQLDRLSEGFLPLDDDIEITEAEDLPRSPWVSSDLFVNVRHEWLGTVSLPRVPWRFEGHFPNLRSPGPVLGANTDEILAERLGLSATTLDRLRGELVLY